MGYTCFCHHLLGHLLGVFFGVDIDSSGWRLWRLSLRVTISNTSAFCVQFGLYTLSQRHGSSHIICCYYCSQAISLLPVSYPLLEVLEKLHPDAEGTMTANPKKSWEALVASKQAPLLNFPRVAHRINMDLLLCRRQRVCLSSLVGLWNRNRQERKETKIERELLWRHHVPPLWGVVRVTCSKFPFHIFYVRNYVAVRYLWRCLLLTSLYHG